MTEKVVVAVSEKFLSWSQKLEHEITKYDVTEEAHELLAAEYQKDGLPARAAFVRSIGARTDIDLGPSLRAISVALLKTNRKPSFLIRFIKRIKS